jgi:hypothetical protein
VMMGPPFWARILARWLLEYQKTEPIPDFG